MPNASPLFLLFSISEKLLHEIFSELDNNLQGFFIRRKEAGDRSVAWGATQGPMAGCGRGPTCTRRWDPDAHKYRGSLKSSLGSITKIYSSTRWEHKNIDKTLAIEVSLSTTPVYQ